MKSKFAGLPKDFFKFFKELTKNNDRDWFNANKDRYKASILAPMCEFIEAMDTRLGGVSDCFVADARPHGGSMFRIYRDVRFSSDKRPYKEHAACHFRHMAGKDAHAPGFYVHIAPDELFFGGGIWRPPNPILNEIRQAIVDDAEEWKEITRRRAFKNRFGEIRGDSLKRPPAGFDKDHPLIGDIKRKGFFGVHQAEPELALTPKFIDEVEKTFVILGPFMEFLTTSVGLSYSLDD